MTMIRPKPARRRSPRLRISRLAVCVLGCGLSLGTGAAAVAATGTSQAGQSRTGRSATSTWTPVQAPLPGTAATDPSVAPRQLTCPAAGTCFGVGSFTSQSNNRAGLIEQLRSGNWTGTQAPVPVGTPQDTPVVLASVSCATTRSCAIAGYLSRPLRRLPLVLSRGISGRWQPQPVKLVAGTKNTSSTTLSSIACPAAGKCLTVGRYQASAGNYQGLIVTQSASGWQGTKAPLPANAGPDPVGDLEWVDCVAAGKCTAVGAYVDDQGDRQVFADTLRGRSWTATELPVPSNGASDPLAYLGYLTCVDATNCVAAGNYATKLGGQSGLFERELAGVWKGTQAPLPGDADPEDPNATINEASCPTLTFCAATGFYQDEDGNNRAVIETLTDGVWSAIPAPAPATDFTGRYLSSVSCPTARFCVAGGSTDIIGLLDTYRNGKWSTTPAPLPSAGFHALFRSNSVSCPARGNCAAFGSYTKIGGARPLGEGLLETMSAG